MVRGTNKDIEKVLEYIGKDYGKCLYMYLDIKEYGLENENIKLWYEERDGKIVVLVLKYYTGMHVYSKDTNFDKDAVIELLKIEDPGMISSMTYIADYLGYQPENYSRADGQIIKHDLIYKKLSEEVRQATLEDIPAICTLLMEDDNLGKPFGYDLLQKQLSERLVSGFGKSWVLYRGEELIAHYSSNALGHGVSVMGGLMTSMKCRGEGIGTIMLNDAFYDLTKDGYEAYGIVFLKPALRACEKVGFTYVGGWTKLVKED